MRATIKMKLGATFALIVCLLLAVVGVGVMKMSALKTAITDVIAGPSKRLEIALSVNERMNKTLRFEKNMALTEDVGLTQKFDAEVLKSRNETRDLIAAGLAISTAEGKPRWTLAQMYDMFPRLQEREDTAAGVLSGGEQQMLTLCRTLMGDPDLILIDEPTEGLAPKVVALVGEYLQALKERGISVLLVEQKLAIALDISQRVYVMGHGNIVFEGTPAELKDNAQVRKEWLEV